jgi:hypothetical protein
MTTVARYSCFGILSLAALVACARSPDEEPSKAIASSTGTVSSGQPTMAAAPGLDAERVHAALASWASRWEGFGQLPVCAGLGAAESACPAAQAALVRVRRFANQTASEKELISALSELAIEAERAHVALEKGAKPSGSARTPNQPKAVPPAPTAAPTGAIATMIVPPAASAIPAPVSGGRSGLIGMEGSSTQDSTVAEYARAARWAAQHLAALLRYGRPDLKRKTVSAFEQIVKVHPAWSEPRTALNQALPFEPDPELADELRKLAARAGATPVTASPASSLASASGARFMPPASPEQESP